MSELTEREEILVGYIKRLIVYTTLFGIFTDQLVKLFNWRADAMIAENLGLEFQDEMLKTLERDFGVKYKKLDPITHEEIKEDGKQD
jgi:hypothetical protein